MKTLKTTIAIATLALLPLAGCSDNNDAASRANGKPASGASAQAQGADESSGSPGMFDENDKNSVLNKGCMLLAQYPDLVGAVSRGGDEFAKAKEKAKDLANAYPNLAEPLETVKAGWDKIATGADLSSDTEFLAADQKVRDFILTECK